MSRTDRKLNMSTEVCFVLFSDSRMTTSASCVKAGDDFEIKPCISAVFRSIRDVGKGLNLLFAFNLLFAPYFSRALVWRGWESSIFVEFSKTVGKVGGEGVLLGLLV